MSTKTIGRATAFALLLGLASAPIEARSADDTPPDPLCTVLGTASRYVGTTVTVRGVASTSGKVTTLADAGCKGAVNLTMDESNSRKRDVSSFRRAVASGGTQANATVFGRFRATGDAQAPYAIDVYSVRDVVDV
ncbi:MAG: hypothetical protein ABWX83_08970, partial [Luteibacter sp.]